MYLTKYPKLIGRVGRLTVFRPVSTSARQRSTAESPVQAEELTASSRFENITELMGSPKVFLRSPPDVSFAHCVSQDMRMHKGVARDFKKKFENTEELELLGKHAGVGGVVFLPRNEQSFVYYLITRERWWEEARYCHMRTSLVAMKNHCLENRIKKIAIPRLGAQDDHLDWSKVRQIIEEEFADTDIKLEAYTSR